MNRKSTQFRRKALCCIPASASLLNSRSSRPAASGHVCLGIHTKAQVENVPGLISSHSLDKTAFPFFLSRRRTGSYFWTIWVSNLSPLLLCLHSTLVTLNPKPPFASTAALSPTSALSCLFPSPAPGLDLPLGLLLPSLSCCQSPASPHIRRLSELSQHMLLTSTDLKPLNLGPSVISQEISRSQSNQALQFPNHASYTPACLDCSSPVTQNALSLYLPPTISGMKLFWSPLWLDGISLGTKECQGLQQFTYLS